MNSSDSKLFGMPRPLAGGLIGAGIYLLVFLPLKFLDYNSLVLYFLALDLETLGRITTLILGLAAKIDMPQVFSEILSIAISTLPAGISGMLIASTRKATRRSGIVFALIYLLFILVFGTLMILAGI